MTTTPTILVLDPNFTPPPDCADIDVRPVDLQFDDENVCADLGELIAAADSETVGFTTGSPSLGTMAREALKAARPEQPVTLLAAGQLVPVWTACSPRLASLVAPPEACGLLLVERELLRENLQNVGHPLWDWLIRHVAAGNALAVLDGNCPGPEPARLPELVPTRPRESSRWLLEHLHSAQADDLVDQVRSRADAVALRAGLFQLHEYLDESHECSQSVQGEGRHAAGDYWHGIMHRREPDYSNAKYWFRRTGRHPIFAQLAECAPAILETSGCADGAVWSSWLIEDGGWNPFAFVDLCAIAADTSDELLAAAAERIQYAEMLLLLRATAEDARC